MREEYKCLTNHVLVEVIYDTDRIVTEGGLTLYLDNTFADESAGGDNIKGHDRHNPTTGKVLSVPGSLFFSTKRINRGSSMAYDTDMEVRVGDVAVFHYLSVPNAEDDGKFVKIDGKDCMFIPYDTVYCVKRDDEVVMVNGWILLEPISKDSFQSEIIITPDHLKKGNDTQKAIIKHMGAPNRGYRDEPTEDESMMDVSVGETVYFTKHSDAFLQYSMHASLEGKKSYFKMQRKDFLGVEIIN